MLVAHTPWKEDKSRHVLYSLVLEKVFSRWATDMTRWENARQNNVNPPEPFSVPDQKAVTQYLDVEKA
jgi:hypothetical protein